MTKQMEELFTDRPEGGGGERRREGEAIKALARVVMPNRKQLEFRASDLESLLPEGHRARLVWGFVERCDLSVLYEGIKSREGTAGRDAIAPEILLALWLYATLESVGAARGLARLSESHDAYRWICGGVQVNYHTLSDFRTDHGEVLDGLLSESVASLMAAGVVKLARVAQDGMRVRASAGTGSFRREDKLKGYLEEARARVKALKRQIDEDPGLLAQPTSGGTRAGDPGARGAHCEGVGAAAGVGRDQAGSGQESRGSACFEHRRGCNGDEDGRWWISACLQRAVRHRRRKPSGRGRRGGDGG